MTLYLTNAGLNVLLRALAGDKIVFSRVQIGNGSAQTAATATALANPLLDLPITGISVGEKNVTLQTKFNNSEVAAGFRCTETGIWVKNQDDDTVEELYAYGTQNEDSADYIAASGESILETQLDFLVFIGDAENISATISESLIYASAADLKDHIEDIENPHRTTAKQVGLGNVPNVSTNNQTPTYTVATTLGELTSGEKLSAAFGKIAKAVSSLISHIGNKSNPHTVTLAQVGAAASKHSHSTSEITSGTLGVARGGTGKSSWSANRIVYASASSALSQLSFPEYINSVLTQNQSGAPFWTPLFQSGSYIGQGKSKSGNPSSITFSGRVPQIVLIFQSDYNRFAIIHTNCSCGTSVLETNVVCQLVVYKSGTTLYWYYDADSPAAQMEHTGHTFYYMGLM